MNDRDLKIDRKKHVCYSKKVKAVIKSHLRLRYPQDEAQRQWENIQLQYAAFLKDLPFLGGKKNSHNAAGGTYDCIALFAYYETVKCDVSEIYEMNSELLLPPFEKLGAAVNLNRPFWQRILNTAFKATAKKDAEATACGVKGYIMRSVPYDRESGICYEFRRCPIAEFAKKHGYLSVMPAICNGDYAAMELLHGKLIRRQTCASGNICDFRIVGDKSPAAAQYSTKTDERGYLYDSGD